MNDEIAPRLAVHHARVNLRKTKKTERRNRWQKILREREQQADERARAREQRCGARTRQGAPCRRKGLGKNGRCRNHGGASTGPKTDAGRARIAAAARKYWQAWRKKRAQTTSVTKKPIAE
jgi:hypothetical protein